jgi:trehalose-phosphatase
LLPAGLTEAGERIRQAPALSLFLDFDGTLTPLVDQPAAARLDAPAKEALEDLSHRPGILPAIVTGRGLEDIRDRVGVDEMLYAGNHGLEISGRGVRFVHPQAAAHKRELEEICQDLETALSDIRGPMVEYKGLTASVHFRRAAPGDVAEIERRVRQRVTGAFHIREGILVLNIVPDIGWDKGAAVCWIHENAGAPHALPICFGDDSTDEDAFRRLPDGVTVRVGNPQPTAARYRVDDPAAVLEFLNWLRKQR